MVTLYSNTYNKKIIDFSLAGYNDIFDESKYFRLNYRILENKKSNYGTFNVMSNDDLLYKYNYINLIDIIYYFKTEQDRALFKLKYNI